MSYINSNPESSPAPEQLADLQAVLGNVINAGVLYSNNTADLAVQPVGLGFPESPGMQGDYWVNRYTYKDKAGDPAIEVAVGKPSNAEDALTDTEPYRFGVNVRTTTGESFVITATVPSGDRAGNQWPQSLDEQSPPKGQLIVTHSTAGSMLPQKELRELGTAMPDITPERQEGLAALGAIAGKGREADFLDGTFGLSAEDITNLTTFVSATFGVHNPGNGDNPLGNVSEKVPDTMPSWLDSTGKAVGKAAVTGRTRPPSAVPSQSWARTAKEIMQRHGYEPGPAPNVLQGSDTTEVQPQNVLKGAFRHIKDWIAKRKRS